MLDRTIVGILISAIAFVTVYAITPGLINALTKKNMVVKDYNKEVATMVARPGGPAILAGILASEFALYAFFPSAAILAIIITTSLAFLVGFADDRKVLSGWFKPLALAGSAVPIILLGVYMPHLTFPLFGSVRIPELYLLCVCRRHRVPG